MKEYGSGYRWTSDGRDAWSRVCRKGSGIYMFPLGAPLSQYLPMFRWKLYEHFTLGIFMETSKFGIGVQNEEGQRLTEFCQENALVIANTLFQQHERWLYTWTSPDGQYKNQTDYILCSWRWRSYIQSAKTRPGADCGSDHELLIAKFRLKLEKVGKTTRPFRCDLNQIPYDYTVDVMNRFKGLDLIDRVPEELWTEVHNLVQIVVTKTIPKKKKCKKASGFLRRPYK